MFLLVSSLDWQSKLYSVYENIGWLRVKGFLNAVLGSGSALSLCTFPQLLLFMEAAYDLWVCDKVGPTELSLLTGLLSQTQS